MVRSVNDGPQQKIQVNQDSTVEKPTTEAKTTSVGALVGLTEDKLAKFSPGIAQEIRQSVAMVDNIIKASGLDASKWLKATGAQQLSPAELKTTNVAGAINQGAADCRNVQLGFGDRTIGQSGCFLGTLTEAHNEFERKSGRKNTFDLVTANEKVKAGGGFSGSNLQVSNAASSLDMSLRWRKAADHKTLADAKTELEAGNLVFAGVDYKSGKSSSMSGADHFLLLTSAGDGTFSAKDPAGGRELVFHRDANGDYVCGKYRIAEVGALEQTGTRMQLGNQYSRC